MLTGLRAATATPVPYEEGRQLDLQVCQSYSPDPSSSQRVTATIRRVLSMTMSPVMSIAIPTSDGPPIYGVLKLYDRRFGTALGRDYGNKVAPHT